MSIAKQKAEKPLTQTQETTLVFKIAVLNPHDSSELFSIPAKTLRIECAASQSAALEALQNAAELCKWYWTEELKDNLTTLYKQGRLTPENPTGQPYLMGDKRGTPNIIAFRLYTRGDSDVLLAEYKMNGYGLPFGEYTVIQTLIGGKKHERSERIEPRITSGHMDAERGIWLDFTAPYFGALDHTERKSRQKMEVSAFNDIRNGIKVGGDDRLSEDDKLEQQNQTYFMGVRSIIRKTLVKNAYGK